MALIPPTQAISPKKHIKRVKVLHDGTAKGTEFSVAELELHDGTTAIGIRHDRNVWNAANEKIGYPTVRGGRPSWFILPNHPDFLSVLNNTMGKDNPRKQTK